MKSNFYDHKHVLFITRAAVTAALYFALSALSGAFGLSSGAIQVRISEALCILPFFTGSAIFGVTLGCFLYNLASGCIMIDVILGSVATLIGAAGTYFMSRMLTVKSGSGSPKNKTLKKIIPFLLPLPTILANSLIVPFVLKFYGIDTPYILNFATVFAGEFISAGIVGNILYRALLPIKGKLFN